MPAIEGPTGPGGGSGNLPAAEQGYFVLQASGPSGSVDWEQNFLKLSDGPGSTASGSIWVTGPQGLTGPTGQSVTGPTGPSGSDAGLTGQVGVSGAQGPTGPQGGTGGTVTGPAGATGPSGAQGSSGGQGPTGAQGGTGASTTGPAGATGPSGAQGSQGNTGPSGAAGGTVTGPTGPQGGSGDTVTGPQGPAGATGPSGPKAAIVPASNGYVELACVESPEVLFLDAVTFSHAGVVSEHEIDARLLEVCEPGSVRAFAPTVNCPVPIGVQVRDSVVVVRTMHREELDISVILIGTRLGFGEYRFPVRTESQYRTNLKFWERAGR